MVSAPLAGRRIHPEITIPHYRRFLAAAQESSFSFRPFPRGAADRTGVIYLRHDLDLDLDLALQMGELEREHGAVSTFFIMLHNPLYNPLARRAVEVYRRLRAAGHEIGLHFDPTFPPSCSDFEAVMDFIADEVALLSRITEGEVYWISFHQPAPKWLGTRVHRVGVFESVYSPRFFRDLRYISDSAGQWKEESLLELIRSGRRQSLHVLVHPALWFESQREVLRDRLEAVLDRRRACLEADLREAVNNPNSGALLYD